MDSNTVDAKATSPIFDMEEDKEDSTDMKETAGGNVIMSSIGQGRGRIGTQSTWSTNSAGFMSSFKGASGTSANWLTARIPISRRESSDWGGSEASSRKRGSMRKLLRDRSMVANGSNASARCVGRCGVINSQKVASVNAFLKAAGDGDRLAVLNFLNSGGDVNAKTRSGTSTALSRAGTKGHISIVALLLGHGAAVNVSGRGGLTPLHEAAGCGQLEVCQVLLGAGAVVAARDRSNRCPLHYASNSFDITKLLLDFGADPDAKDKNGQRPDMMSVNPEARALLRDARVAVREFAVGDNASRVIASLRRELENTKQDVQVTKEAAANEAKRREQLELEVVQLREQNSALSQEVEFTKKEAATAKSTKAAAQIPHEELSQMRASLQVAQAAAAEEKRRRLSLEENFDGNVAEAVAKAIAAAATRLLDRMPEEGGYQGRGDVDSKLRRRRDKDPRWPAVGEHHPGDDDATLAEPVRALPAAVGGGEEESGAQKIVKNEVERERAADGGDGDAVNKGKKDAQGKGWAEYPFKGWLSRLFCLPPHDKRDLNEARPTAVAIL